MNPCRITRIEIVLLVVITGLGIAARVAFPSHMAVEHFDEGIYASNLWFPDDGFAYPDRHLYAPPFIPALIEWSLLLLDVKPWAAFLPSLILGMATVPLVWWVTRRWFGPAAGIGAASLIALSDFHIALSRSALTDAPLAFFLLLSVWLLHAAVSRCSIWIAAAAGAAVGLAWSTKYNGWLPLAIALSGTVADWLYTTRLIRRRSRPDSHSRGSAKRTAGETKPGTDDSPPALKDSILILAIAALVAMCVWSPVWFDLQPRGGYTVVSGNHRRYVVGFTEWLPSLLHHEAVQRHYAGWLTLAGCLLASVAAALVQNSSRSTWNVCEVQDDLASCEALGSSVDGADRSTWNGSGAVVVASTALAAVLTSAIVFSPLIVVLVLALIYWLPLFGSGWAGRIAPDRTPASPAAADRANANSCDVSPRLASWFCLAWTIGLLIATPLYHPYPRLVLPLLCVGWIGTGAAVGALLVSLRRRWASRGHSRGRKASIAVFVVAMLTVSALQASRQRFPGLEPRQALADVAARILAEVRDASAGEPGLKGIREALYVYAEPGLLFHLPQTDVAVRPVTDLSFARPGANHPRLPTYLLVGPHAESSERYKQQFAEVSDRLELVTNVPFRSSDFVQLDDVAPNQLEEHRPSRIRVYRVRLDPAKTN